MPKMTMKTIFHGKHRHVYAQVFADGDVHIQTSTRLTHAHPFKHEYVALTAKEFGKIKTMVCGPEQIGL